MTKLMFMRKKNPPTQKRHTHRTAAGLEDAIAVLLDVERDGDALLLRIKRALEILRSVRAGPHVYDPNSPSGLRIRKR
jgi:hypothetical protein